MNIKKEDIDDYLLEVKQAIKEGRYRVSPREKNEKLFIDYVINEEDRKNILLSLCSDDFCEKVNNEHEKFKYEILYIFRKDINLLPRFGGEEKNISLYIKINKLKNLFCVVVSFHEQEHELNYFF